jgi:hypothetical protein
MTNDYTQLTNEQLSELIYRLSVESRNRYEVQRELEKVRGNIDAKPPLASGSTIAVNGSPSPVEANPDAE